MRVGVPYYPEHWPRDRWQRDATLMKEAGVRLVRLGEFAWSRIEPRPGEYTVEWIREAIDLFQKNGIEVILCTPTPTYPPWLHGKYPDIHQVRANGRVVEYGQRQDACKNHPGYRRAAMKVTEYVARELGGHPNVVAWQTDNEFGCHGTARCYCSYCEREFQEWLSRRFEQNVNAMNRAWGTSFWSQEYNGFSEVSVPRDTADRADGGGQNPGLVLDFYRFSSDVQVDFQRELIGMIRQFSPGRPITHNFMGTFHHIDYFKLAEDLDIVSWDNYPFFQVPGVFEQPSSFPHELMRGLKRKNVWVMEQASGPGGWTIIPPTTEPGRMRLWAYQAVARGTDMVSFFRWRTNRFGTEQFWHGVLDHHGEPKRRYKELARFAEEMAALNAKAGDSSPPADYALIYDYETLWSYEIQPQVTSGFGYSDFTAGIVNALSRLGLSVDIVPPEADLSNYPMVICPSLHLSSDSRARALREYVESGGHLVLGPRSGVRDIENAIVNAVLPGTLRELVGAEVPEYDMFSGAPDTRVFAVSADGEEYEAFGMADLLEPSGGAESLLTYKGRYYSGRTAATRHALGNGACYYLGTALGADGLRAFLSPIAREAGISTAPEPPATLEVTRRVGNGSVFRFYLNHSDTTQQVTAMASGTDVHTGQNTKKGESITLEPFDVRVIEESI